MAAQGRTVRAKLLHELAEAAYHATIYQLDAQYSKPGGALHRAASRNAAHLGGLFYGFLWSLQALGVTVCVLDQVAGHATAIGRATWRRTRPRLAAKEA